MSADEPIFQKIFGAQWDALPAVMKKHYANRSHSADVGSAEGRMNVKISKILRLFTLILRLAKIFPPFPSVNIPVTVDFRSEQNSNAFCFERIFYYPDRAPYRFFSKMIPAGGDEMIEFMGLNIGWRTRFRCDGDKIHLDHRGYCIKIFDRIVMLPLEIFVGEGSAMEQAIDDNHFQMTMVLRHRLFGALYAYDGLFAMTDARR